MAQLERKNRAEKKYFTQKLSKLPFHILIALEISNSEIVNSKSFLALFKETEERIQS
jgi:hypothetical protein